MDEPRVSLDTLNAALADRVYLGLGDHPRALDNIERAVAADSQMLPWLGQDAMFDSLRAEPRFVALLKRFHFVK
jgi:hypothetical protein